ncbi:MAG TPA: IPT/TIG domain-containing protein, partial [Terriglobia bacterium]|nr:IPT/TIG domain-containing protein [Terriglobia bacterium]
NGIGGVDITGGVVFSASNSGLQFGPLTFGGRVSSTAPSSVSMQLTVLPSTPLGPKNLAVNRGTDASIVSGAFVITDSSPSVNSATPSAGSIEGGTVVTVRGANFRPGAQLYFAGLTGTGVQVLDSSTIQATAPANAPGGTNVIVVNSDGTWGVGSQVFTYISQPPTINRVSPLSGSPATQVIIEGDHFDNRTQNIDVQFNGVSARVINASLNTITTVVPIDATTGPITVSVFGQTATGPAFTVSSRPPNANFAQPTFNFIDASSGSGGTALTFNNNDDAFARVSLPFNLILFRDIYLADSPIAIGVNGYLSLEPLSLDEFENAPLPSKTVTRPSGSVGTVPPSLIAPFWDDLILRADSAITTKTVGSAPNRQFVVEWSNMSILDEDGRDLNANLTFEAVLYEGSNDIQFLYRSATGVRSDGSSATVGAQNLKRDTAIQTGFNQPIVSSGYFTTYHFQNGSYAVVTLDVTPPAKPVVTDEGPVTSNGNQLAASWSSDVAESGIVKYQYAIGTTAGGTDVFPFTSTTQNSAVVTGLSLRTGVTYYFAVKAISGAGRESEVGVSAGVRFDPTYQPQVKIIPSGPQNGAEYTGIAFLATSATSVVLRAMDAKGNLITGTGIRNPTAITLAAGQQYAKLISELFGLQSFDGWIEADASTTGLGIFVATGSWDMQRFDGSVMRDPSMDFVLFHTGASAILVNPTARPANVTLTELASGRSQQLPPIPPKGRL